MKLMFTLIFSMIFIGAIIEVFAHEHDQKYYPVKDPLVLEKLEKWQDLKFGLLMHWGAYSQWGIVESWSLCPEDYGWCQRKKGENPLNYFEYKKEYENLQTTFNPVKFDPEKWAKAAKNAGMKYVVFTTKHHDGFCMFDSKYTDYKITDEKTPFHSNERANVTKEIFAAFRNEGLWTGAYFSKPDWHCEHYWYPYFPPFDRNVNYDPEEYPERWEKYVQFTHNQILELMTDYGKVDILWLDGGWVAKQSKEELQSWYDKQIKKSGSGFLKQKIVNQDIRMDELAAKARQKQPGLIVVDRAVEGRNQNYLTPENQVPGELLPYPWESCIIAGGGWSYVPNAKYKSTRVLVHILVDIVSKGGNLLLNIAPGPDGTWHAEAYDRLKEVGDWMKINSEAIYKTRPIEPYREGRVCLTREKDGSVYAIYLADKNEKNPPSKILLSSIQPEKNAKLTMLGSKKKLKWKPVGEGFEVEIPESIQKNPPCSHAWVVKISKVKSE